MIRRFLTWLSGPTALTIARTEYQDALDGFTAAQKRRDTRAKHETWSALNAAMHNLMAAERRG